MKIDVKKVAKLSNLTLSPEEELEFEKQLNDIVTYIAKLNQIDTSNILPTPQVTGLKNVFRTNNSPEGTLSQDEALSGTNKTHNGLFVVEQLVDTTS